MAFGCTLQKRGLASKIRKDIANIAVGPKCVAIHYFVGADLPVAKRHELQATATEHGLHLEVYDGTALAEFLCDPDLFWIANEYLSIPSDAYPSPHDIPDWYADLRDRWQQGGVLHTFANFQDLKLAARSLLTHSERHADINFWLECLSTFVRDGAQRLAMCARYEMAVAAFRTKATMVGHEPEVRAFLTEALETDTPSLLMDAASLLMYCSAASMDSATELSRTEIAAAVDALRTKLTELKRESKDASRLCFLMDIEAFSLLIPDLVSGRRPDVAKMMATWNELASLAEAAPLFPAGDLALRLTKCSPLLVTNPGYEALTERIDTLVAKRTGSAAMARNCVERSKELSSQGHIVLSLRELNRAKANWWASETLEFSLNAMLMAAMHYQALGLHYAANYYSLAAAYIAIGTDDASVKSIASDAFLIAADSDYRTGAWLNALSKLRAAHLLATNLSSEGLCAEDANDVLVRTATILGVAKTYPPSVKKACEQVTKGWLPEAGTRETVDYGEKRFWETAAKHPDDIAESFRREPFADCLTGQVVRWEALGLKWEVTWQRGRDESLAAEQFLAMLQVTICDLARYDLYLIPSRVHIEVVVSTSTDPPKLQRIEDNALSSWQYVVPARHDDTRPVEELVAIMTILEELSLRPDEWPVLNALRATKLQNVMVGDIYSKVATRVTSVPDIDGLVEPDDRFARYAFRAETHDDLGWNTDLVAEYKVAEQRELMRRRYDAGPRMVRHTLPRLLANIEMRALLANLRSDGWKDWQLLAAITGITATWRMTNDGGSHDEKLAAGQKYASRDGEQSSWTEVPLEEFTRERFELQLRVNAAHTLQAIGLVSRQSTPNYAALVDFARAKVRYFEDDLPHPDPFIHNAS